MNAAEFVEISEIKKALSGENVFAITDSNVASLYPDVFNGVRHAVMPAGEGNKNLGTVASLIAEMVEAGCNRKTTVIAIGGGVVGDTAGYVAASYMRGVKWINVPTTLLAMVDSSVGGKTGVDVGGYKNICGAFWLPERVLTCTAWLDTLPEREWLCGLGEMVKHAFLDGKIYEATKPVIDRLVARDMEATAPLIEMSVRYKESIVEADFKEGGLRKRLNVGHTVGHAVEKLDSFRLSHGQYVALGIIAESTMLKDMISPAWHASMVEMSRKVTTDPFPAISAKDITDAARADKKNATGKIVIMLPTGSDVLEVSLSPEEFEERLESCISDL